MGITMIAGMIIISYTIINKNFIHIDACHSSIVGISAQATVLNVDAQHIYIQDGNTVLQFDTCNGRLKREIIIK